MLRWHLVLQSDEDGRLEHDAMRLVMWLRCNAMQCAHRRPKGTLPKQARGVAQQLTWYGSDSGTNSYGVRMDWLAAKRCPPGILWTTVLRHSWRTVTAVVVCLRKGHTEKGTNEVGKIKARTWGCGAKWSSQWETVEGLQIVQEIMKDCERKPPPYQESKWIICLSNDEITPIFYLQDTTGGRTVSVGCLIPELDVTNGFGPSCSCSPTFPLLIHFIQLVIPKHQYQYGNGGDYDSLVCSRQSCIYPPSLCQ